MSFVRSKRRLRVIAVTCLGSIILAVGPGGAATRPAEAVVRAAELGTTAATAAGSCWEIKTHRSAAASGSYWLLTSRMSEPRRHYCDMDAKGGGWVLVGKGRDGWVEDYLGKGDPVSLQTPDTVPMGSTTVQLSSPDIDALLDGGRVDALADGVRLRRATNRSGRRWQEVRMHFASRDRWSWTFGALHPLDSYSFGKRSATGNRSRNFGMNGGLRRVVNRRLSSNNSKLGFAYGPRKRGSASASTYLWSATDGGKRPLPYAMVYLRPQVSSSDFSVIPDDGLPGWTRPDVPRNEALPSPWGVAGIAGSPGGESSVEVQAFAESAGRMYVGGNFGYVQRDGSGTHRVAQPFLAAFDVRTGEWLPEFHPTLDEQVRALTVLPNGELVAGGDFTKANGVSATGIVALDPVTGATSEGWQVALENRVGNGMVRVQALEARGEDVFIGGRLTHVAGGTNRSTFRYMRMLARVSSRDGTPVTGWNPGLNGTVTALDASADGSRVYAAGHFSASNGVSAPNAAAILTQEGAPLAAPLWTPTWSAKSSYQQAIREVDGGVYVGGSEHSLFRFDTRDFTRTAGSITKRHGDMQAIAEADGVVYAGCHCNEWSYENAYAWPKLTPGWTQADTMRWFGLWDAATGKRIPDFTPTFSMRLNRGIWALAVDSTGVVWAGGDVATVSTPGKAARWSGGFARFPRVDSTAPATPSDLSAREVTATTVRLVWNTVTDAGGGVRYQILRDDRPIVSTTGNVGTLTVPRGGDDRFFVRAVDGAGNYSATTRVLAVP